MNEALAEGKTPTELEVLKDEPAEDKEKKEEKAPAAEKPKEEEK